MLSVITRGLLLSVLLFYSADSALHNIEMSTNCGDVIHLRRNQEAEIVSGITNGYCGVVIHAESNDVNTCRRLCMRVEESVIHDCSARVTVTGIRFARKEDPPKELSCFETFPDEWCLDATMVRIEAIRDLNYQGSNYNYNMTVYPDCTSTHEAVNSDLQSEKDRVQADKDKAHTNMVHGIIAGICLACIFLFVLFCTYCYYKNRAYRGKRYDYPSAKMSKGPSFAGFKAKMNIRKGQAAAKSTGEPEEKYVRTDETKKGPENVPLVEAAEATPEEANTDGDTKIDIPEKNDVTSGEADSAAVTVDNAAGGNTGNDSGGGDN